MRRHGGARAFSISDCARQRSDAPHRPPASILPVIDRRRGRKAEPSGAIAPSSGAVPMPAWARAVIGAVDPDPKPYRSKGFGIWVLVLAGRQKPGPEAVHERHDPSIPSGQGAPGAGTASRTLWKTLARPSANAFDPGVAPVRASVAASLGRGRRAVGVLRYSRRVPPAHAIVAQSGADRRLACECGWRPSRGRTASRPSDACRQMRKGSGARSLRCRCDRQARHGAA